MKTARDKMIEGMERVVEMQEKEVESLQHQKATALAKCGKQLAGSVHELQEVCRAHTIEEMILVEMTQQLKVLKMPDEERAKFKSYLEKLKGTL